MNGLCRIPALQSQGRMNTWLSLPPWEQAPDKVHVQDRLCLSDRVSNKCPQPQAGWDGWLESCSQHTYWHFPGSQTHPHSPLLSPCVTGKQQKPHQNTKSLTKHHHRPSTPLQQSKTKLTLKSKLLPSIPRTFCFLFSSDTSNFCMMSRQYSGVTLFICTETRVEGHLV